MKQYRYLFFILGLLVTINFNFALAEFQLKQPLEHIKKQSTSLESYLKKGPVLIVNIATRCGYTGQLEDLEKLYQKYQAQGLTVLGVPSNNFGGQTPEDDQQVAKFCRLNYGVSFPLLVKQEVKGESKSSLMKWLLDQENQEEISWNFEKFLLNKNAKLVARFKSSHKPLSEKLQKAIESQF